MYNQTIIGIKHNLKKDKTLGIVSILFLYLMIAVHLVWFNIPTTVSLIMVGVCIGIMIMSFIMYSVRNIKAIKNKPLYSEVISGRRIVDK